MLAELDKLGVLTNIHPTLGWRYATDRDIILGVDLLTREHRRDAALATLAAEFAGAPEEAEALARWLRLPVPLIRLLRDAAQLVGVWERLGEEEQQPSITYKLLHGLDQAALEAALRLNPLLQDARATGRVADYLGRLRFITTELNGDYLRSIGVPPGPIYRRILEALHIAKLDGLVPDRAAEETYIRKKLNEAGRAQE
jgi:tRNA nucleotidyltransferase (CCA-adding enzyme)